MSDPERLLHGSAGALSARLVRAGHEEAPSRRSFERTLAAVGVATTTLGAAGTAGALGSTAGAVGTAGALGSTAGAVGTAGALGAAGKGATTLTLLGVAKWAGMGVAGGVMVSLAAHGIETRGVTPRAAASVVTAATGMAPARVVGPNTAAESPNAAETAPLPHEDDELTEPSAASTDAKSPSRLPPSAPLSAPTANEADTTNAPLAAEVAFVDRGRARFQGGDARGALAALGGYEREFPERRLLPEVLFLRMEASVAAGDTTRAEAFAHVIVRDYGKSPHAARARAVLGEAPAGQR